MNRCVATNAGGARCLYEATHGNDHHLYADDRDRYAFFFGCLSTAVGSFLEGRVDQEYLARTFIEIETTSQEAKS